MRTPVSTKLPLWGAPWTLCGQAGMRQALQLQHAQFACGQAHAHAIDVGVGRLTARQHGSVVQNRDGHAASVSTDSGDSTCAGGKVRASNAAIWRVNSSSLRVWSGVGAGICASSHFSSLIRASPTG
jgi:hypothetical protein